MFLLYAKIIPYQYDKVNLERKHERKENSRNNTAFAAGIYYYHRVLCPQTDSRDEGWDFFVQHRLAVDKRRRGKYRGQSAGKPEAVTGYRTGTEESGSGGFPAQQRNCFPQQTADGEGICIWTADLCISISETEWREPSNTSWIMAKRSLLIAAGMLAMAAVICLFYFFRFTIKSPDSASRLLDGTVRGTIPFESKGIIGRKKTKKALLLNSPLVSMDFAEASRRAEARVEYHMRRKGYQVLLLDGDLRKPAQHKVFEENSAGRTSVDQVLKGEVSWKENLYYNKSAGIWELFQFQGVKDPAAAFAKESLRWR